MPVLSTKEELITALENSVFSADPIADLARKGYTLSPTLNREWESARARKRLPPIPRGVGPASFKGKFAFKSAPPLVPVPDIPPGSYDVVAGLTLEAANEALGAVFDSGTIPHQIALDQLLSPADLLTLASFFRVDRPGGQISRLHIRSAPTLASTTDGSSVVALQIPIQLDWVHVRLIGGRKVRQLITKATGTLQLTMRLVANVISGSKMTVAVQLVAPLSPAESPRLMLDANSPVQLVSPAPPNQVDGTAFAIQFALALQFQNDLKWPLSPNFTLPIGTLEVRQLDVVAQGGALVAGLKVAGTDGAGDPSTLANLLPDSVSNIFLQVQDIVPNLLVRQAVDNGTLTARARQQHSNAVVDSARASFQDNAIVVSVKGRLVNECGFSDLGFWATHTTSFKFQGSSVEIDQKDDNGIDLGSSVWCLLTGIGLLALALLTGGIFLGFGATLYLVGDLLFVVGVFGLTQLINGGQDGSKPTMVDLTLPIPGSDALPTLSGGNFQVTNGAMLIAATAGTQTDNINKDIYVRFLAPGANAVAVVDTEPLAGVKVELMNQDVPAPPSEETPPVPADTATTVPGDPYSLVPGYTISTTYSFEPPTSDQKLLDGVTDLDGVVRFELLKNQFPIAGMIVAVITTSYDADYPPPTSVTQQTPVTDTAPDLYFKVTMPDGSVVDSRQFSGGFLPNVTSSQVGSLSNPLTITLGPSVGGFLEAASAG